MTVAFYELRVGDWSCTSNNWKWLMSLAKYEDKAKIFLRGRQIWPAQLELF